MRGILLAFLLTLVGSQKSPQSSQIRQIKPNFTRGKIQTYAYKATIHNTLEGKDTAESAFQVTANLEISAEESNKNILNILNPQVEDCVGFRPRNQFARSPKKTAAITKCFLSPYKFEYSDGRLGNIYGPEDASVFCVNLVRGMLNMFYITLRPSNMYELPENGIGGECLTRYIVQDDRKNNGILITKTKDLNNCPNKIVHNVGMSYIDFPPLIL